MQEHSQQQKRKQLALRYFTYGVMSLAVVVISALCILLALGYGFDFKQNTVVQRALVQFRSFPQDAVITQDNSQLSFRTPGKANVDVGQHAFTMHLEGYRDWTKTVTLDAGELRWLNYARLIPSTVTTNSLKEFTVLSSNIASPDRKWMAIWADPAKPELTIADLRDSDKVQFTALTIPSTAYTAVEGQPSNFQLVEWDFGARFMLVKHVVGDKVEYLRIDRTNEVPAANITTALNIAITDIHFSGTSGNVFYARDQADLRKLDIAAGTISSPIASQVNSFVLYKTDTASYVSDKDDVRHVGVHINSQNKTDLRTYDTTQPILTSISSYFSDTYVAVARGTSVEIIKNPLDKTIANKAYATVTLPVSASWLQFSNSGRFVVAGSGTQFVTYDLETRETFSVNLPGKSADNTRPLQWLDDYILVSTADQSLRLSEFDGGNQQVITDAAQGFYVTLSEDGKYLYSIAKTSSGYSLQASKMTIGN
ncbi:PEGA domain-containing protein [Candidatus Saccharibacteria bacterium]|nr:MAG: PEGA domain-containing protein [Candidatus Saccharibacteria bacterium]